MSKFYPQIYLQKVTQIDKQIVDKYNIKALILDVDNTLMDYDRELISGLTEWKALMDSLGVKMMIVSNSNKLEKVTKAANHLQIEYISFAKKPTKGGLRRAQKMLQVPPQNIAVVGDQIFTDVLGANRCKMISVLVKPVAEKDILWTRFKRPLERKIKNRYFKKNNIQE